MKILVIQQKMIGDVLASSIICNNLCKAYPEAQIDYLVYKETIPVLKGNTSIDNIILFEEEHKKNKTKFLNLALKIRATKYDLVIDAYLNLESALIVFLSGAKRTISYKKNFLSFLYTDKVYFATSPETQMGLAIERRFSLLNPLNLEISIDPYPKLFVTAEENQKASTLFNKHQINRQRKTIMISLLGSENAKTYPLNYMTQIIDYIATNNDVNIIFNYFPKQINDARKIFDACSISTKEKIYFDLLGDDLRTFIALLNQCDLVIGNDGGAINMAKALNKPTYTIFSPWIDKESWSTFDDGIINKAIHLKDFYPKLLTNKSRKERKKNYAHYYNLLKPSLIFESLTNFLNIHLH
ncbi:glycosyltransferase family 9 protein [Flavobacterium sp. FBOR7N2.3]|uniref:Glycosyltransferase family 9 protein n=1 Tax=Flavobacterium magnesitis TaxID=3138077 RepID=A0ABV4TKH9_9FLAO